MKRAWLLIGVIILSGTLFGVLLFHHAGGWSFPALIPFYVGWWYLRKDLRAKGII